MALMEKKPISIRYSSPEIIRIAVMMYVRYLLSSGEGEGLCRNFVT